ncbi:MAG: DUF3365 domain-containing protein [Candidatus Electrothrix sp. YB6]
MIGRNLSIYLKFLCVFLLSLLLTAGAFMTGLYQLRMYAARQEAGAVADQIVAFRSWVAQSGMVWVRKLVPGYEDFLVQNSSAHGSTFYGKNPALATRELSVLARKEASRATFRVTSDDYRYQGNAPDDFEASAIKAFKQDGKLDFAERYENGTYRYARPLLVRQECLKCHGDPKDAPPEVLEKYGTEKAFGYKVGQVRGIISVTLPVTGIKEVLRALLTPWTAIFLVLIFAVNFLFVHFLAFRLIRLTAGVEAIAAGRLDTELVYINPSESDDELDHVYHSVNLLKRSLIVLFRRLNRQHRRH